MEMLSVRHSKGVVFFAVVSLLAAALLLPAAAQQKGSSGSKHTLFELRGPGLKAPLVGFFYSADEEEFFSIVRDGKTTRIPFTQIKRMRLTPGEDRFSRVTVERTDGTTIGGSFANLTLLFIDPQKNQPIELPLSAPDDSLADFGNRTMVNCALGTFTRKQ